MMEIPGYFRYIHIKGLPRDPLEMVQGIGGSRGSSGDPVSISIVKDASGSGEDSLDAALWTAQSAYIEGEVSYLEQLNKQWKETEDLLEGGRIEAILDTLGEKAEEGVSLVVFAALAKAGIVLTGGVASIVGVMVSVAVGYGFGKLKDAFLNWLKEGNKLIEAMIAEDTALLGVEQSLEHYRLRDHVIARHERTIARLLQELEHIKTSTEQLTTSDGTIAELFKKAFLSPKMENGKIVKDENGTIVYEGFFDRRLRHLRYNNEMFEDSGSGISIHFRGIAYEKDGG